MGDAWCLALVLNNWAALLKEQGEHERARALYEESLALKRELGDRLEIALSTNNLGKLARLQGDYGRAAALHTESLALRRELGDRWGTAICLNDLALLAQAKGDAERAARLWGAAEALRESIGCPLPVEDRAAHVEGVAAARTSLGEAAFGGAWSAGRALSLEQAIAEALAASEAAPAAKDATPCGQTPLTARERELAALLAGGRTNRQMAEELGIAERTVDTHVSRMLRKLGLTSRTQVAAWAAEQGLLAGGR